MVETHPRDMVTSPVPPFLPVYFPALATGQQILPKLWEISMLLRDFTSQNRCTLNVCSEYRILELYRTIILSVVLYGCETWSLRLRQERKLRVFENNVLRIIFGPRRTR